MTRILPRGNRYQRRILFAFGLGEREEKHDERKKSLVSKIFVIDPIPFLPIRYGGKSVPGTFTCAKNPYQRRHRGAIGLLRRGCGKGSPFCYPNGGYFYIGRQIEQDFE